jgi:hypothetical protein
VTHLQRSVLKTVVLVIVLAGVAAYAWFVEYKGGEERAEREEKDEQLFAVERADVVALTYERRDGAGDLTRMTIERTDSGPGDAVWRMLAPLDTPADGGAVDVLIGRLVTTRVQQTLAAASPDSAEFGLKAPRLTIGLRARGGETRTVSIGDENPFDGTLYARREGEGAVLVVEAGLKYSLDKTLFDLRDKRLLDFEAEEAIGLDLRWSAGASGRPDGAAGALTLARPGSGDPWRLTAPIEDAADATAVGRLLDGLRWMRASGVVSDDPYTAGRYGLAEPRLRATVSLRPAAGATQPRTQTVEVGDPVQGSEDDVHARRSDRPTVFSIPRRLVRDLTPEVFALRNKDVVAFDRDKVVRVTFTTAGATTLELARADASSSDWRVVVPRAGPAKAPKVSSLLRDIANLKGSGFPDDAAATHPSTVGLDPPEREIVLADAQGGVIERLSLGRREEGRGVYATNAARRRVLLVDASRIDGLPTGVADYLDEKGAPPAPVDPAPGDGAPATPATP